jgi:hypothetical protein
VEVHEQLQEISRGIDPAILSRGGLGPAIKTLARRSAVPVTLDADVERRLPESVEVAAYYVVADALRTPPSTLRCPRFGCARRWPTVSFGCRSAATVSAARSPLVGRG